jgi:DNA-binding NarL/FixJ family response regulator
VFFYEEMERIMPYINARQILPPELIAQIQEHLDGQLVYIPKKSETRSKWGSKSGSKALLQRRNQSIRQAWRRGDSLSDLADSQHLSEDTIRKIIFSGKSHSGQPAAEEGQPR